MATLLAGKLAIPPRLYTTIDADISPLRSHQIEVSQSESPVSPLVASDYQRSASYTYLPTATRKSGHAVNDSFSEEDLIASALATSGRTTPEEYDRGLQDGRIRSKDLSLHLRGPTITVGSYLELGRGIRGRNARDESVSSTTSQTYQRGSVSTNASQPQRRSWFSVASTPESRSPSPAKRDPEQQSAGDFKVETLLLQSKDRRSLLPRPSSFLLAGKSEQTTRSPSSRRTSMFNKRPLSNIFSRSPDAADSMPVSFSSEKLSTLASSRTALPPRLGPLDRIHARYEAPCERKKDELWNVFRALDADYSKFASKSMVLKANVIRSGLMPFLETYHDHQSTYILRPEDLERRALILNKWWSALLDMLHGRNNQSLSGTDRPIILDAMAGIMERPEWRLHPSICPLDRRTTQADQSQAQHKVLQAVKDIFIQNLAAQIAFVVDKMSFRHASASLVTFCGKACAFAFMFVPGVADILVRLWDLQSTTLRRVIFENGIDRSVNLTQTSQEVLPLFPENLHGLAFTTLAQYTRKLHTTPTSSAGTANIQWWGYWQDRWKGHESELFYVFVKHFHILVSDFLHSGSTKEERMCVPGMLPVHAQILSNLDAALHRKQGKNAAAEAIAALQALDDVYASPDAVASALPVPPINASRSAAENRLIMLTRDFLSDRTAAYPSARQLFAETFNDLLQAAARGISVYDTAACYALLELLEVALPMLVRYEQLGTGAVTLIQPEFWHLMSRRMISSESTLTEIRLYAFLYTVWDTVVCDANRKADLCLGLLLDPAVFASRFNHWSPMVRAYYMRLLCWRVGRYDGDGNASDLQITQTLLDRLQTTWSHHLWLRDVCAENNDEPPQTAPCNPAVYRRLRIVRSDTQTGTTAFPMFDVITPPSQSYGRSRPATRRSSTLSTMSSAAELERHIHAEAIVSAPDSDNAVRGFFRKALGSKDRAQSQDREHAGIPTRPGLSRSATDEWIPSRSSSLSGTSTPTGHARNGNFKFAFEYSQNIKPPRPLWLAPPRLPAPAQRLVDASRDTTSPIGPSEPRGIARRRVTYTGRALAEWTLVVGECHKFFERRRHEGVVERYVETPSLSVDIFKRPGS